MKLTQFLLVSGAFWPLAHGALLGSTVTLPSGAGTIQGLPRNNKTSILSFLGIPFAEPPVGSLRWAAPQPVNALSSNPYNATEFGPGCYQSEISAPAFGPISEDCLTVNVWTGAHDTADKRPVMVWIYGGGFQFGASNQPNYNGANLAQQGVVLVSFNYRLGVLGFLGLSELDVPGVENSGNFGLQDQLAALRWVKENIAAFGGDPDNVTVFGESAGAHSVGLLLSSPLSGSLFNKAIMESGAYWDSEHGSIQNFTETRTKGSAFMQKLGVSTVSDLRALSAETVNNAALWNSSTDPAITAFAPNIDNYVVPAVPAETFNRGNAQKVSVLAGFNAAEEYLFLPRAIPHNTTDQFRQSAQVLFGPQTAEFLSFYDGATDAQATQSALDLDGDLIIREQTFEALDRQASVNHQTVYAYYFTYTSPYSPVAAHTAEINFVFGNLGPNPIFGETPGPSATDVSLSRTMMEYWTNFAKFGNPNNISAGLPGWPQYTSGNGFNFLEIGNNITAITNPYLARFEFIGSLRHNGSLPVTWRNDFDDN